MRNDDQGDPDVRRRPSPVADVVPPSRAPLWLLPFSLAFFGCLLVSLLFTFVGFATGGDISQCAAPGREGQCSRLQESRGFANVVTLSSLLLQAAGAVLLWGGRHLARVGRTWASVVCSALAVAAPAAAFLLFLYGAASP